MGFFFGGGFQAVFLLIFFCILGIFVVTIARGIGQWNKNNHSPRLTVDATVEATPMPTLASDSLWTPQPTSWSHADGTFCVCYHVLRDV